MKSLIQTHWDRRDERVFRYKKLASFPGSPTREQKIEREGESLVKVISCEKRHR